MKDTRSKIQATELHERPSTTNYNSHAKNGLTIQGQDIDIFESDDGNEMPGPGAYFEDQRALTSFKTGKKPERLQFFGSTVERFNDGSTKPSGT